MERIKNCDKLLKKYKKTKLEVDHKIYREAKLVASTFIKAKKETTLNKKLLKIPVIPKTLENFEFSWYALTKAFGILHLPKKGWQHFV